MIDEQKVWIVQQYYEPGVLGVYATLEAAKASRSGEWVEDDGTWEHDDIYITEMTVRS